jgi:hypothetical protein
MLNSGNRFKSIRAESFDKNRRVVYRLNRCLYSFLSGGALFFEKNTRAVRRAIAAAIRPAIILWVGAMQNDNPQKTRIINRSVFECFQTFLVRLHLFAA